MPKLAKNLSLSEINKLKKEGVYAIGHVRGLCVRVSAINTKSYCFRYSFFKKARLITIGDIKAIKLNEAKAKALTYRAQILNLIDPFVILNEQRNILKESNQKQDNNVLLPFHKVFEEYIIFKRENGAFINNKRAEKIIRSIIYNHVYPLLKFTAIEKIEPIDIQKVLKPNWTTKIGLSERLVSQLKQIFSYAQAMNYIKENPVNMQGALGVLLKPLNTLREQKGHYAALDYKDIPEFCLEVFKESKTSLAAKALLFSILTATRSKAVRYMKWSELDLRLKLWKIPLENDKSKIVARNREIFLSSYAITLLKNITFSNEYVFFNREFKPFSDSALSKVIKVINTKRKLNKENLFIDKITNKPITQHGTARATFKTWTKADDLGNHLKFASDAVELCLLHERKDPLKGAYDRSKFEKERRYIIEEWGKYCCSLFDINQK